MSMERHLLRRLVHEDRGHAALAYVVVTATFSILVHQPSLLVAAVDRLSNLVTFFILRLQYVF